MSFVSIINLSLLAAIMASLFIMVDHMSKFTRRPILIGSALFFVGCVAETAGYFKHWDAWTDTLFFGGAAMLMVANMRLQNIRGGSYKELSQAERLEIQRKADLYAYFVGALTIVGLLISWAFPTK